MRLLTTILIAGLAAGAMDITYAFIVYGPLSYQMSPVEVLQSVAAGWLGKDAANAGDATTALLGLATHFMIATVMAAVFVLVATRWPALKHNAVMWGLLDQTQGSLAVVRSALYAHGVRRVANFTVE